MIAKCVRRMRSAFGHGWECHVWQCDEGEWYAMASRDHISVVVTGVSDEQAANTCIAKWRAAKGESTRGL